MKDEIAESRLPDISDMGEANLLVCKFETRIENLGKIYSDILGIYSGESEEFKEFKDERDELLLRLKENKDEVKLCIKNIKANTIICEAEKDTSDEMARDSQLMICAKDLYAKIKSQYNTLLEKCE